jgi:Tetratricopeptide repeat
MRFHHVLNAALAGVFVVPAATLSGGESRGLEQALAQTVRAIESLSGLRDGLEHAQGPSDGAGKDPAEAPVKGPVKSPAADDAVPRLIASTEAPIADAHARDELLVSLRQEVSRLQMVFDQLTAKRRAGTAPDEPSEPAGAAGGETAPAAAGAARSEPQMPVTTGLDDATRGRLAEIPPPVEGAEGAPRAGPPAAKAFEEDGFRADPLRLGRAYYRAGRYAEGLALLETLAQDPEATYWAARCLERLGRLDEALAAYQRVIDAPDAGYFADRAQGDRDFLAWKRDFEKRLEPERKPE